MKARFVVLVYAGSSYKSPGRVERTNYSNNSEGAIVSAKCIAGHYGRYVEVWDIKLDKIVWTE